MAFRTKCELAIALLREQARIIKGKHLAVFDGGYALKSVVRPLVLPEGGASDRIPHPLAVQCPAVCLPLPPEQYPEGKPDRSPSGSAAGAAPPAACGSEVAGRNRLRLRPAAGDPLEGDHLPVASPGWEVPVKAIVASVESYKEQFTL